MKRALMTVIATIVLIFAVGIISANAEVIENGGCGTNVTWTLDDAGTLTISGEGNMQSYSFYSAPWESARTDIKNVIIEKGVTSIGDSAFFNCTNLTDITIPDGITTIGQYAFYGCHSLTSITLPESITWIEKSAWDDILQDVYITDIASWCAIYFEYGNSNPLYYAENLYLNGKLVTNLVIPDDVKDIGHYAFGYYDKLESVSGGANLEFISHHAFYNCANLSTVSLKDKVRTIRDSAFSECTSLKNISIPKGVTTIDSSTFSGCSALERINIPDTVTEIGASAFNYCVSLKSITLPEGITNIGINAFSGCSVLENINIPSTVTSIDSCAFYDCYSLESVYITDISSWCGIKFADSNSNPMLYADLYINNELVTSITLPDTVTSISNYAFSCCAQLESINIPNSVTSIGDSAFAGSGLTYIYIPDSVTSIGESAFVNCTKLGTVEIPDSVTLIGNRAFYNCSSLSEIDIPGSVSVIDPYTFSGCSNLSEIRLNEGLTKIGVSAFRGCSKLCNIDIPDGVTGIGVGAFEKCTNLEWVFIPNTVTSMGSKAFHGCDNAIVYAHSSQKNLLNEVNSEKIFYYHVVTYNVNNEYKVKENVFDGENANLLGAFGTTYTYYTENGDEWDGKNITTDITVYAVSEYTITYTGDYEGTDSVMHGLNVQFPTAPEGYYYEFYVGGKSWNGENITSPHTVEVKQYKKTYYIKYINEYIGTDLVEHGENATLPVLDSESHHYTFTVGGEPWDGTNVTSDLTVLVWENINVYTISYKGDYAGSDTAEHGASIKLPKIEEVGYHYCFTVDENYWDGSNITSDATVTVTKTINIYTVVFTYENGEQETITVKHGENAILPVCEETGYRYIFFVEDKIWDGTNVTSNLTVKITKELAVYMVVFIYEDEEQEIVAVKHGENAVLPVLDSSSHHYVFMVNGAEWSGINITSDVKVNVSKAINTYTVTFMYENEEPKTVAVEHGENVTLPVCEDAEYHFEFFVDENEWDGTNITSDLTVKANKVINVYKVIFTYENGEQETITVEHGEDATLPVCEKEGYHYYFTVDGNYWDGVAITSDLTVNVKEEINIYTISFMKDYEDIISVKHGENVTLPTAPAGCIYRFTADGKEWTGLNITSHANVTVTKLYDGCDITEIGGMHDVVISGNNISCKTYYASVENLGIVVSQQAQYRVYTDAACSISANDFAFGQNGENKIFYIKVVAQSGRSKIYTVTAKREHITDLGDLEFVSSSGGRVTLKLQEPIPGEPAIAAAYSLKNSEWTAIEAAYNNKTQLVQVSGLAENTDYWIKIVANYGDTPFAESGIIELRTNELLSDKCDIINVISPVNAQFDKENSAISARVANDFDTYKIEVEVSAGATWAVYRTATATVPLEDNTVTLREGRDTTVYIRVIAEDGYTTKTYSVTIYRQKKSAKPTLSYANGLVTITAPEGSIILYTTNNDNPIPGLVGQVYSGSFAASDGTVIKARALNPNVEEYSDIVIYHVKAQYTTNIEILYFDLVSNGYEWSVYLSTDNPEGIKGDLIIATYSANNKLLDIYRQTVDCSDAECEAYGEFKTQEAAYCKIFLWDNENLLKPLGQEIKIF